MTKFVETVREVRLTISAFTWLIIALAALLVLTVAMFGATPVLAGIVWLATVVGEGLVSR